MSHLGSKDTACTKWGEDLNNDSKAVDIAAGIESFSTVADGDAAGGNANSDSGLFGPFPPRQECPICFLPLPVDDTQSDYKSCCGNIICAGCEMEHQTVILEMNEKRSRKKQPPLEDSCPFCRAPFPQTDELVNRLRKRMRLNDPTAFFALAGCYHHGRPGLPKDENKAIELLLRGAELGSADACSKLAYCYGMGKGVAKNQAKAREYVMMAAMKGDATAHHNLGVMEYEAGNITLAMKHLRLAAAAGFSNSLGCVKEGYKAGFVSKDEYAETLRAYQTVWDAERSDRRDRAAKLLDSTK